MFVFNGWPVTKEELVTVEGEAMTVAFKTLQPSWGQSFQDHRLSGFLSLDPFTYLLLLCFGGRRKGKNTYSVSFETELTHEL